MVSSAADLESGSGHKGPSLFVVALVYVVLSLASLIPFLLAGGPLPSPFDAGSVIWSPHPEGATPFFASLQLAAGVPLGIFAATAVSRLRFLGVRVAGVDIAFFGGIAASIFTALASCLAFVLAWAPSVAAHAFHV